MKGSIQYLQLAAHEMPDWGKKETKLIEKIRQKIFILIRILSEFLI